MSQSIRILIQMTCARGYRNRFLVRTACYKQARSARRDKGQWPGRRVRCRNRRSCSRGSEIDVLLYDSVNHVGHVIYTLYSKRTIFRRGNPARRQRLTCFSRVFENDAHCRDASAVVIAIFRRCGTRTSEERKFGTHFVGGVRARDLTRCFHREFVGLAVT